MTWAQSTTWLYQRYQWQNKEEKVYNYAKRWPKLTHCIEAVHCVPISQSSLLTSSWFNRKSLLFESVSNRVLPTPGITRDLLSKTPGLLFDSPFLLSLLFMIPLSCFLSCSWFPCPVFSIVHDSPVLFSLMFMIPLSCFLSCSWLPFPVFSLVHDSPFLFSLLFICLGRCSYYLVMFLLMVHSPDFFSPENSPFRCCWETGIVE